MSKSYRVKVFSSSFHNTLSFALLDNWSPASLLSWSAHLVRCRPTFPLPSLGSHMVSLYVHLLLSILATWPLHFHLRHTKISLCYLFRYSDLFFSSRKWFRMLQYQPSPQVFTALTSINADFRQHMIIFLHPVRGTLETLSWEVQPHLIYSSELAPSNYRLFASMGHALAE